MNIYILNRLGKTIYVRALRKPSNELGGLYDITLEFYAKRPRMIKGAISILRVENDDSEWFADQNPNASIRVDDKLGWKFNFKMKKNGEDVLVELAACNGQSY